MIRPLKDVKGFRVWGFRALGFVRPRFLWGQEYILGCTWGLRL